MNNHQHKDTDKVSIESDEESLIAGIGAWISFLSIHISQSQVVENENTEDE